MNTTLTKNLDIKIMNRNHLKYLVIVLMFLDHFSYFFPPTNPLAFPIAFFSRLTAPVMAFFIAEGYYYTRDVKKYMKRLLIFAVISYIPYIYYRCGHIFPLNS